MTGFSCDHVHVRTPDPDAAAAFYVRMFGATEKDRVMVGDKLRVVLDLGGLAWFVEAVPPETPRVPPAPFVGIEHVCLRVRGLPAAVEELRAKGAEFVTELASPRPGVQVIFLQAPDGVRIELIDRDAG